MRNATQRKRLLAEVLEPRALLAGDISPFWNYYSPTDVNADGYTTGLDALVIVNELNVTGARNLRAATSGGGEGEGPSQNYYDVNNDGWITGLDAISIVNRLNGEGEGNPFARLVLQPVALNTNDVITEIVKGQSYELRVLTVDLGETMFMSQTRNTTILSGVAQSYFDVNWNTTQTEVQLNEVQAVTINGNPTGGTFRLTINGQQTANITFTTNANQTAAAIQTAVDALFGANRLEVRGAATGPSPNRYTLRYLNQFSNVDQNEAANSGNAGSLTGGTSPTIMFSEVIKGASVANSLNTIEQPIPAVVTDALAPRSIPDGFGGSLNDPYYPTVRTGNLVSTGINDVGGLYNISGPIPGLVPREILRVRMNAIDGTGATPLTFNASLLDYPSPGGDTLLSGFGNALTSLNRGDTAMDIMSRVEIVSLPLTITETVSANPDSASINEDATTPVQINVVTNDTKTSGGTLAILGEADTTGTAGTVTKINSTTFSFTPAANFSGVTTFKYTVTNGLTPAATDTTTVTITVNAVNDAPLNGFPTDTQMITEGSMLFLSSMNGNAITVNDVDADPGNVSVRLQTPAGINISLGSVAGLTSVSGNNSNDVTLVGTQALVNSALNNTVVTPPAEFSGAFGITVTSSDLGNTGIGGTLTDTDTVNVSVAAVNDAPVVNLGFSGTQMVLESEALVFNSPSRLISFTDVDAGSNPVQVTLSVTDAGNKLKLASTAGLTFVSGDDSNNVVIRGPLSAVNAAVAGLTYTAAVGFGGQNDTLTININDQGNTGSPGALSDQKTVTIAVDTLIRPFARADMLTVSEGSSAGPGNTVNVLMNDLVNLPDPGPINYFATLLSFSATSANGGSITRNDNGTPGVLTDDLLVYVPLSNFSGTDTFQYVMNDTKGTGANSMGTVTVTVTEINDQPVAVDDPLTAIAEDSGVRTIPFSTLLGNDNAGPLESGQTLNITAVSNAVGGTVMISGTNVLFTPTLNFNGSASFDYTITDNGTTNGVAAPLTDVGQVTFTITEVNDAPVATNDPLSSIAEDSGNRTISFASLLANDSRGGGTDENGQTLMVISVGSAVGGTVSISGTDVIFSPTLHFNGAASFSYTIQDNGTTNLAPAPLTAVGTVSFTVTPVNDAPVAVADLLYSTGEDVTLTINAATGVLANDTDVDGDTLTAIKLTDPNPAAGTLTAFNANGSFTFVPFLDFVGMAEFTYQANDGQANSNIVTVRINITEFNDPPTAGNFNFNTNEDTLLVVNTPGLVGAPTNDPEGSPLSVSIVQGPATGVLTNNGNGSFSYQPASNASGVVTFTYRVNDGFQNSTNVGTVTINVIEQNDNPTAVNDGSLANPLVAIKNFVDQPFIDQPFNVLANDSIAPDVGETLTITAVQSPTAAGGTVTIGTGGNVLYTPLQGYEGADQFTYTITDSRGGTATATVFLDVVNFIPTDITGVIFVDSNNNGVQNSGEAGLGGIDVTLSGTDLLTQLPITPVTVQTEMDGSYIFPDVRPGTYFITQDQTAGLRDGLEAAGNGGQTTSTNDQILVDLPLLGLIGGSNGNNFAERGVDANQLVNPAGLYKENLSSSTSSGFVLSEGLNGDLVWSWALQGWNGLQGISIEVDSDQSAATLTIIDGSGPHSLRIFVDPNDVRNTSRPLGSLARFRILGHNHNGDMLIRVDGTAAAFGMTLVSNGAGEGEFAEGVDAVMGAEAWA